jgi:SpoVK/Ycf46/Vps4 family AAA+-type ATPase
MNIAHLSLLSTNISWQELALSNETMEQVNKIKKMFLMHTMQLKPSGQIILFYGASTNTKLNVAALLGKDANKPIYKINLATLSSNYIGETEKNLEMVFEEAQKIDALLLFDEADALFGKQTDVKDAHDKYANLEVSYLLQRLENYNGITIVATNNKDDINNAFIRRFYATIHFPK